MRVTLDSSIVIEAVRGQAKADLAMRVIRLHAAGQAEIAITRYVEADVPREPLATEIRDLPILRTAGLITFGSFRFGSADGFASQLMIDLEREMKGWKPSRGKPPDSRDWAHLHAHVVQRRDVFLTWDAGFLELGVLIQPIFDAKAADEGLLPLRVTPPETFLEGLESAA